ncbi:MAG: N-acetyltransferase [Acidimicrobiales bacterium]
MDAPFLPPGSPLAAYRADERPDLWEAARSRFDEVWPEYNHHGTHTAEYFGALVPRYAHLQVLLCDTDDGDVIARGRTIPLRWDGSLRDLPPGIDAAGRRAVHDSGPPDVLCALAGEVATGRQGRGLSRLVILGMGHVARAAGFPTLLAPVRPSWKHRFPMTPIDRYARWTRPDGLPFDPWLRVHARLGATMLRTEPLSLHIEAPLDEWEAWTHTRFGRDGAYVFPQGLAPLRVRDGIGSYDEPNVWMRHDL